jgi:RHS repeat-associated protein
MLEYAADYYPFGAILREWENCEKSRFLFTYKERDAETGWDNLGARLYDSDIGRFLGVDPIADQFPHVNSYNYAENEPVANIDLHGLQRFYGADGSLLGKYGDSQEERVVHRPDDAIKVFETIQK